MGDPLWSPFWGSEYGRLTIVDPCCLTIVDPLDFLNSNGQTIVAKNGECVSVCMISVLTRVPATIHMQMDKVKTNGHSCCLRMHELLYNKSIQVTDFNTIYCIVAKKNLVKNSTPAAILQRGCIVAGDHCVLTLWPIWWHRNATSNLPLLKWKTLKNKKSKQHNIVTNVHQWTISCRFVQYTSFKLWNCVITSACSVLGRTMPVWQSDVAMPNIDDLELRTAANHWTESVRTSLRL